ncbi:hypothetical protein D3C86_1602230 [compost metagenome]
MAEDLRVGIAGVGAALADQPAQLAVGLDQLRAQRLGSRLGQACGDLQERLQGGQLLSFRLLAGLQLAGGDAHRLGDHQGILFLLGRQGGQQLGAQQCFGAFQQLCSSGVVAHQVPSVIRRISYSSSGTMCPVSASSSESSSPERWRSACWMAMIAQFMCAMTSQ